MNWRGVDGLKPEREKAGKGRKMGAGKEQNSKVRPAF